MKIKFGYIISALCLGVMTMLPMQRTLAQGRGRHVTSGTRSGRMNVRPGRMNIRGPQFGSIRTNVPRGAKSVKFNGDTYHWHNGAYYHPQGKRFVVVRPPIGLRIGILPLDYFMFTLGTIPYYYYYGTFYTPMDGQYVVIDPPVGALVKDLPSDCEIVTIDGKTYYKVDDTYYKAVVDDKNNILFEVVGKSAK